MEFGIERVLSLKRDKVVSPEGVSLPGWQVLKEIADTGCKCLGFLESDEVKETKTKDLFATEYNGKNKILGINTLIVEALRYSIGN